MSQSKQPNKSQNSNESVKQVNQTEEKKSANSAKQTASRSANQTEKSAQSTANSTVNGATNAPKADAPNKTITTHSASVSKAPAQSKLSKLAFACSIAALGLSAYAIFSSQQTPAAQTAYAEKIVALETQLAALEASSQNFAKAQQLAGLKTELVDYIDGKEYGLNKTAVQALLAEQPSLSPTEIEALISERFAALPIPEERTDVLGKEEVNTLIKQALIHFDKQQQPIDFSEEISKVRALTQQNEQILAEVQSLGGRVSQQVNEALDKANARLTEQLEATTVQADQRFAEQQQVAQFYAVAQWIELADIAVQAQQYVQAAQYLEQALEQIDTAGLSNIETEKGSLKTAIQDYRQQDKAQYIAQLLTLSQSAYQWKFRVVEKEAVQIAHEDAKATSFMGRMKHIGAQLINNVVSVNRSDEENLSWLSESAVLQSVVRENVLLNVMELRSLLILGDIENANASADALSQSIARYFDKQDAQVIAALALLEKLPTLAPTPHDLAGLANRFRQLAGE